MNGHDDYFDSIDYQNSDREFDEEGNLVDEEETQMIPGNPMIDRDQDEMQHEWAREAHNDLMERLSFNQDDR
jgi:hypothetical protein